MSKEEITDKETEESESFNADEMMKQLGLLIEDEPKKEEDKEEKGDDEKEKAGDKDADKEEKGDDEKEKGEKGEEGATDEPKKKVKVVKKKKEKEIEYKPPVPEKAGKTEEEKPAAQPQQPDIEDYLDDDDKEDLHVARFAARKSKKYKDFPQRLETFFAKREKYLAKKLEEDPDYQPAEDDEYQEWESNNRPGLSAADERNIVKMMAKEEAAAEMSGKITQLEKKIQADKLEPQIKKASGRIVYDIIQDSTPQEIKELLEKKKGAEARKLYPDEWNIIQAHISSLGPYIEEFMRVDQGVSEWNPDKNSVHREIGQFIEDQSKIFVDYSKSKGGRDLYRDGKYFVDPFTFSQLNETQRNEAWTWNSQELLSLLRNLAKMWIKRDIGTRKKQREEAAYYKTPQREEKPEKTGEKEIEREKKPDYIPPPPPKKSPPPKPREIKPPPSESSGQDEDKNKNSFDIMKQLGMGVGPAEEDGETPPWQRKADTKPEK